MLVNPFDNDLRVIEGTPFIQDERLMPYIGARVSSGDPRRIWSIQEFLVPSKRRALQGVRARLQDQKGFVTFCNQRDLEVLLGVGQPQHMCHWLHRPYVSPLASDWYGFCVDELDLWDDLYERELFLRLDPYTPIPTGTSIHRLVHLEEGKDVEELWVLIKDYDHERGVSPDPHYNTIHNRWVRVERVPCIWELKKALL